MKGQLDYKSLIKREDVLGYITGIKVYDVPISQRGDVKFKSHKPNTLRVSSRIPLNLGFDLIRYTLLSLK
jgi:hypothetical protein